MNVEYHKWWSPSLNQDMELKVYGHSGRAVIVFPTLGGRFFEYEDFGMIGACQELIEAGRYKFITVDSVDRQSWLNDAAHPSDRARRHGEYESYVLSEVVPFIRSDGLSAEILTTGCDIGAFHAANFFFKHSELFCGMVGLSGRYHIGFAVGGYMDGTVYYDSPLHFLPGLTDENFLGRYRRSRIILCSGQGAFEDDALADTIALGEILAGKSIPAWVDIWGPDVTHDWPWWRRQIAYFLERF